MAYRSSEKKGQREAMIRDAVEGWRRSGQTQAEYCEERGVPLTTFRGWSKEYRAKEREQERLSRDEGMQAISEREVSEEGAGLAEQAERKAGDALAEVTDTREPSEGASDGLILVDVVDRGGDERERQRRPGPVGKPRLQVLGPGPEGRNEPVEIELPSGIVIRLYARSEAWRIAGIVREVQNTC